jgi:hypothetical protein
VAVAQLFFKGAVKTKLKGRSWFCKHKKSARF